MQTLKVVGPHTKLQGDFLVSEYKYQNAEVQKQNNQFVVTPKQTSYTFKTNVKVPKLGIMLVGLGGNNGTTFTGGIIANREKLTWHTKKGENSPNYYGSITQASTTKIGVSGNEEVFLPLKDVLPLVNPNDVVIHGWDISDMNLGDALGRAKVLAYNLQEKLYPYMKNIKPLKAIYYPDFIAMNQKDRATNVLPGNNKLEHMEQIRKDIKDFKKNNNVDKVIVLWTANTERFCNVTNGVHDTAENLLKGIEQSHPEISPSTVYAAATILEGCSFINGSPQNTLVPGIIDLAERQNVFIVGDDFKSGQTKFKTAFVDFLVSAGIKPKSIVSYNHLGNNDGMNLSSEQQFKSKEKSKSTCVDDILDSNTILFQRNEDIDHTIVIKYVPSAGDTKKALDEYVSDIFLNGNHVISLYNVCEDSLLAAPLILDLILLTELFERIEWKCETMENFQRFHAVLSTLGYLCKAPLTAKHAPLVNSLFRQKMSIENIFKACAGLPVDDNTLLEFRCMEN